MQPPKIEPIEIEIKNGQSKLNPDFICFRTDTIHIVKTSTVE